MRKCILQTIRKAIPSKRKQLYSNPAEVLEQAHRYLLITTFPRVYSKIVQK